MNTSGWGFDPNSPNNSFFFVARRCTADPQIADLEVQPKSNESPRRFFYTMRTNMKLALRFSALILALCLVGAQTTKPKKTDAAIKQEIIDESIASYRGNCPCPYNTDRAGRRCGARSAYSRPGGASPICYAKDVTQKMVEEYRRRTEQ
jgi:hypothetical protein